MIGQFLINGLITGILYSLSAIGFALVYNTTRIFHLASASLYVIAAYTLYYAYNFAKLPLFTSILAAIVITTLFSIGTEWVVYRPLNNKKSSLNVIMIASIGLMIVLNNLIVIFFSNEAKMIETSVQQTYKSGSYVITTPQILQLVVGTIAIVGFMFFLRFTRFGLQTRALSCNVQLFQAMGYSICTTRLKVFALSGLFFALASSLTVYEIGLTPHMGMGILINAMVAMIIGGTGRFSACILGGVFLGIVQAMAVGTFESNWQNGITFLGLILFLLWRPQGFIGYKKRLV